MIHSSIKTTNRYTLIEIVAVLGILTGVVLRVIHLPLPFELHHSFNEAFYTIMASNFESNGLIPIDFSGELSTRSLPGILNLLLYFGSFSFLGVSEISARIIPLIFSIASIYVFYKLAGLFGKGRYPLIATSIYALIPMNIYFGTNVQTDGAMIFFLLLSQYLLLRTQGGDTSKAVFAGLAGGLAVASKYASILFIVPILLVYLMINRRQLKPIIIYSASLAIPIVLTLGFTYIMEWPQSEYFINFSYLTQPSFYYAMMFRVAKGMTPILMVLWLPAFLLHRRRKGDIHILSWYAGVLITIGAFSNMAMVHEYYLTPLSVPLALTVSLLLYRLSTTPPNYRKVMATLIISLTLLGSIVITTQYYYFEKTAPFAREVGSYVKDATPPDSVLLVAGSVAPPYAYYSQRLVLNNFTTENILPYTAKHPGTLMVRYKVIESKTLFIFNAEYTEETWDSYLESNAKLVKEFTKTETNLLLTRTYFARIYIFE